MIPDSMSRLFATEKFGAYAMSLDQTIVFWNQGAERILGFPSDQVVGRRCYEVVTGLVPGGFTPACLHGCPSIRALRAGEVPRALTMQMLCASGERREVLLTPLVVAGAKRNAPLLLHLFDDSEEPEFSEQTADSVREGLTQSKADVLSDNPVFISGMASTVKLTKREVEVLRLVALGWDTKRIAGELDISLHTVLNHIRNFRQKLNAQTKLEAVVTAVRLGVLDWI